MALPGSNILRGNPKVVAAVAALRQFGHVCNNKLLSYAVHRRPRTGSKPRACSTPRKGEERHFSDGWADRVYRRLAGKGDSSDDMASATDDVSDLESENGSSGGGKPVYGGGEKPEPSGASPAAAMHKGSKRPSGEDKPAKRRNGKKKRKHLTVSELTDLVV